MNYDGAGYLLSFLLRLLDTGVNLYGIGEDRENYLSVSKFFTPKTDKYGHILYPEGKIKKTFPFSISIFQTESILNNNCEALKSIGCCDALVALD